jgi:hypothetical protein
MRNVAGTLRIFQRGTSGAACIICASPRRNGAVRIFLVVATAVSMCACGQQASSSGRPIALTNGDFEQPGSGSAIPGWQYVHHAGVDAYTVSLDTDSPAQGKASAKMKRTQPQVYGTLSQLVSMKGNEGKTVRVTARMKSDSVGEKGWKLFMSARGLHGNVYSEPMTGTTPWKEVRIEAKMPPGVDQLNLGATLLDAGTGWVDDVQVHIVD